MANNQPCKVCETEGVFSQSDWLVTAQSGVMGFEPGQTFWVCMPCLFGLTAAWAQAQAEQAQPDEGAAVVGDHSADATGHGEYEPHTLPDEAGPGVLEQVEADEGRQQVNGRKAGGRKSTVEEQPEQVTGQQEAETADVHQ